jgi:hypothetical protein
LAVVLARVQVLSRRVQTGQADPDGIVAGLVAVERAARSMERSIERLEHTLGTPSATAPRDGDGC